MGLPTPCLNHQRMGLFYDSEELAADTRSGSYEKYALLRRRNGFRKLYHGKGFYDYIIIMLT